MNFLQQLLSEIELRNTWNKDELEHLILKVIAKHYGNALLSVPTNNRHEISDLRIK